MDEFIVFNKDQLTKDVYIVSTKYPFYIGKLICFDNSLRYAEYTNRFRGLTYAQVYPYAIIVEINKTLAGVIIGYPLEFKRLDGVAKKMAKYYLDEIIRGEAIKFERYHF